MKMELDLFIENLFVERDNDRLISRKAGGYNDDDVRSVRISFSYSCARISHVWREGDSHTDNLEEFIVTKRDQPQGALHCTEIADTWRKGFDSQILIASVRLRKIGTPFCKSLY